MNPKLVELAFVPEVHVETNDAPKSDFLCHVDCIVPILKGHQQPRRPTKPLPEIDLQLVAACKAQNPNFGQWSASPVPTGDSASPGPAAEPAQVAPARRRNAQPSQADEPPAQAISLRLLPRSCKGCRRHERMKVVSTKNKLWSTHSGNFEPDRPAAPFPRGPRDAEVRIPPPQPASPCLTHTELGRVGLQAIGLRMADGPPRIRAGHEAALLEPFKFPIRQVDSAVLCGTLFTR